MDSITPKLDKLPNSDEVKGTLDQRWQAYLERPEEVLTLEELMARVAKERKL